MRKATILTVLATILSLGLPGTAKHQRTARAQGGPVHRVHAPYFGDRVAWAEAGIFWFGRVDPPGAPGQNYADVRVGYTDEELRVYVNVEDYYVWYDETASPTSDLTRFDAAAIYLDTAHDRAASPQRDDYLLRSGLCVFGCDGNYRREARGTGAGWDFGWDAPWDADNTAASWSCDPGPNSNDCDIDYGWWTVFDIPWPTLGLSGPPVEGTLWGLGVVLYDRDDRPPAGYVPPQHWPKAFDGESPDTWAELAFGRADYTPPSALVEGTSVIQRGLNGTVEDAWVGGGGTCSGGHEGDPEHDNHGADTSLFVANQYLIADFPCFSKSFLRFSLNPIPAGKSIVSATLSLHQWGNSGEGEWGPAYPSLIWLFTVDDDWEEDELTWNNAPLARENLTATWVDVCTLDDPCGFPGVRYDWDATQAVAEAHAAGDSLNLALYTADWNFHSSKYFGSSEVGDWNAEARPKLTVTWGEPVAELSKELSPRTQSPGRTVTYTLFLVGSGDPLTVTDDLPPQVSEPGSIQAPDGSSASYDGRTHRLSWTCSPTAGFPVTITFPVTVEATGPEAVPNTAVLTDFDSRVSTDTATLLVDPDLVFLPLVLRTQ